VSANAAVGVLGAGAFGTALAIALSRRGQACWLWSRDAGAAVAMQQARENAPHLRGCRFPASLAVSADLAEVAAGSADLLIATPSPALRGLCRQLQPLVRNGQGIASAAKGLEPGSGRLAHQVIGEELGGGRAVAALSGPTFARELAAGLPTAVTIASNEPAFAARLAQALHGDGFRAYTSGDLAGVEIGGAAKNVLAIAVGIADGLGFGANTRAALITRGLGEIARLATALGAQPETLMGLSGLGDVVLTCTDDQSRNRRFGIALGQGKTLQQAQASIAGVVEGIKAAPEVVRLAQRLAVRMPLHEMAGAVLAGSVTPKEAMKQLSERPSRAESG
jgi:glycerol-3-phosphate dehydrogenase (NAD(P)+)